MAGLEEHLDKLGVAEGESGETKVALIAGVTGIVGNYLQKKLLAGEGGQWSKVYGVARRQKPDWLPHDERYVHISCDILDDAGARSELSKLTDVTHVFFCTWIKKEGEQANIETNTKLLANVLDFLVPHAKVRHVVLQTGTKQYLGPFEMYGQIQLETPWKEDLPRIDKPQFYYTQEDVLFDRAKKHGFSWSVHRPYVIIGYTRGNYMNLGTTLAVYASICKATGLPFQFPGTPPMWNDVTDVSDAGLIAEQEIWAATNQHAANECFNTTNGDVFRWRNMWRVIADFYGLEVPEYKEDFVPLSEYMKGKEGDWEKLAEEHGLVVKDLNELAQWWFVDAEFAKPFAACTSMNKSKEFGFLGWRDTEKSFIELFRTLREEKLAL